MHANQNLIAATTTTVKTTVTTTTMPTTTTPTITKTTTITPVTTTATTSSSPEPFTCPNDMFGKYPNPNDCKSFYECVAGVAYLKVSFRVWISTFLNVLYYDHNVLDVFRTAHLAYTTIRICKSAITLITFLHVNKNVHRFNCAVHLFGKISKSPF